MILHEQRERELKDETEKLQLEREKTKRRLADHGRIDHMRKIRRARSPRRSRRGQRRNGTKKDKKKGKKSKKDKPVRKEPFGEMEDHFSFPLGGKK